MGAGGQELTSKEPSVAVGRLGAVEEGREGLEG